MSSSGRLTSRPHPPSLDPLPAGVHALDDVGTLLAVPPSPSGALLVFLHGAGGTGAGVLGMVEQAAAARGVTVLLPSSGGQTWDLLTGGLGRDVAALDASLDTCFGRLAVDRVALGGFSDGGSYALSLGLANGDLVEALLAFSPGFAAPPSQEGAPRVWISHGTADRVLPVDRCGRRVAALLGRAGYEVRYEEFEGGHVVPPHLVETGLDWWLGS